MTPDSRTVANASRIVFNFLLGSTSGQLSPYPRPPPPPPQQVLVFIIVALFCHQPNIFIFEDKMFILTVFVIVFFEEDTPFVNEGWPFLVFLPSISNDFILFFL